MNPNFPLIPESPSSSRNPNFLPFNSGSLNSIVSSNPNLPPCCSNGNLISVDVLPPLPPTKLKIQHRKPNKQKALTIANPLSPPKRPKKEKTVTLAKPNPPCSECGKQFQSAKSLYGHMRCHPERNWRGINPPASHDQSNMEPVISDSLTELSEYEMQAARNIVLLSEELHAKARANRIKKEKSLKKRKDAMKKGKGESSGFKKQKCERVNIINGVSSSEKKEGFDLDLNLPAPVEKDEECETSEPNPNPNPETCSVLEERLGN